MKSIKYNQKSLSLLFIVMLVQGCPSNKAQDDNTELSTKMDSVLSLEGTEQLYLLDKEHSKTSGSKSDTHSSNADRLFVIDEKGESKSYLPDVDFDRFFVISHKKQIAYVVRLSGVQREMREAGKKGRWFVLKNGEKPIHLGANVKATGEDTLTWREETEFVGQTESNGGLVFSDGNYVAIDGTPLNFGKNIRDIEKVNFVSGDYVALTRKIKGQDQITLIYVTDDKALMKRRSYNTFWLPDFVQISKDGKGLISDHYNKTTSSTQPETNISKLEDEFETSVMNAGTRGQAYQRADLGDCFYFNSSVRLGDGFKKPGALITCKVPKTVVISGITHHDFEYKLLLVTKSSTPGVDWDLKPLHTLRNKKTWTEEERYKVFTRADSFILMNNDGKLIFIPSKSMAKNTKEIATNLATVEDIRLTLDGKNFMVLGEKVNGDNVMQIYSGVDGSLKDTKDLDL